MSQKIHCELFNLGNPKEMLQYETLLNRVKSGDIFIVDQDKTWGNKAEGVLFVYVTYEDREDY